MTAASIRRGGVTRGIVESLLELRADVNARILPKTEKDTTSTSSIALRTADAPVVVTQVFFNFLFFFVTCDWAIKKDMPPLFKDGMSPGNSALTIAIVNSRDTFDLVLFLFPKRFPFFCGLLKILSFLPESADMVRKLCEHRADVNIQLPDSETPLLLALSTPARGASQVPKAFLIQSPFYFFLKSVPPLVESSRFVSCH